MGADGAVLSAALPHAPWAVAHMQAAADDRASHQALRGGAGLVRGRRQRRSHRGDSSRGKDERKETGIQEDGGEDTRISKLASKVPALHASSLAAATGGEKYKEDEGEEEDEEDEEADDEDDKDKEQDKKAKEDETEGEDEKDGDEEDSADGDDDEESEEDDQEEEESDGDSSTEDDANASNATDSDSDSDSRKDGEVDEQEEGPDGSEEPRDSHKEDKRKKKKNLDVFKDKDLSAEEKKIILKLRKRVRGLQKAIKQNLEERVSIKKELKALQNDTASREEIDANVEEVQKESKSSGMANFLGGMWKELRMFQTPFYEERLEERLVALEKQEPNLRDSLDVAKAKLAKHEQKWWTRFRPW